MRQPQVDNTDHLRFYERILATRETEDCGDYVRLSPVMSIADLRLGRPCRDGGFRQPSDCPSRIDASLRRRLLRSITSIVLKGESSPALCSKAGVLILIAFKFRPKICYFERILDDGPLPHRGHINLIIHREIRKRRLMDTCDSSPPVSIYGCERSKEKATVHKTVAAVSAFSWWVVRGSNP